MLLVSLAAGCLLATSALQRSPPARRRCSRSRLPTLQVNSDSRATQEYFDFLLGKTEIEPTEDQPSVIVGGGKIGEMLREFGERRGFEDVVLGRGEAIPSGHPGPVYLAVPAAELDAAIELCPEEKRDDLVFLSDGQLEPLFQRHGLYGPCQASLWLALMRRGGKPVDGRVTDLSGTTDGLSRVHGKWSGAFAMRMGTGGILCREANQRDARRTTLEKLVFVTAYNLVGAAHGGLSMGEVAGKHGEEVGAMCRELASFVRYTLSVSLFSGLDDRLADYARTMEFLPTRLDAGAFPFTSGYFYRYTKMAGTRTTPAGIKVEIPDTTPLHTEYLLEARDRGLVGKELLDAA
mmetsp:Transcript_24355/g.79329  ORF Transcript_24355/g.79329 Transcript_24355/m.79329 type:complete len:349 (+) Transcript_24355:26-1072(+)